METFDPDYLYRVGKARVPDMEESYKIEAAIGVAQKKQLKEVLVGAGPRRLGYVREVSLVPRPKAMNGVVMLLDVLSPTINCLTITAPPAQSLPDDSRCIPPISYRDNLEIHLLNAGISFPSLTYVRFGSMVIAFMEMIPLLCNAAPNISFLDFKYSIFNARERQAGINIASPLPFPKYERPTGIKYLRAQCFCSGLILSTDNPLIHLIKASPHPVDVSITEFSTSIPSLVSRLGRLRHLRDLHIGCELNQLTEGVDTDDPGFRKLVRLSLMSNSADDVSLVDTGCF